MPLTSHSTEPGKGYAEKVAERRAKLEELKATQPLNEESTENAAGAVTARTGRR